MGCCLSVENEIVSGERTPLVSKSIAQTYVEEKHPELYDEAEKEQDISHDNDYRETALLPSAKKQQEAAQSDKEPPVVTRENTDVILVQEEVKILPEEDERIQAVEQQHDLEEAEVVEDLHLEEEADENEITVDDSEYLSLFQLSESQIEQIEKLKGYVIQGFMDQEEYEEARDEIIHSKQHEQEVEKVPVEEDSEEVLDSDGVIDQINSADIEKAASPQQGSLLEQLQRQKTILKQAKEREISHQPNATTSEDSGAPTLDQIVKTKNTLKKVDNKKNNDPWKSIF